MSGRSKNRRGGQGADGFRIDGGRVVDESGRAVRMIKTGTLDLGDLAPAEDVEELHATFNLRGETFRVHPELSELTLADLLEAGNQIDVNDPRAATFVKDYARAHVHEDDFERFWATVKRLHWESTQIMVMCWKILDGITENPTGGRSDSSDGPPGTKTSSDLGASQQDAGPADDDPMRAAYLRQIDKVQARTGEDGNVLPINAAVAAQLVVAAKARGIDLEPQSVAATA
jgi:hypothetical protein